MKIALVHEFLNQLGGAEKVLHNFLEIWPDAEIHVILYNKDKTNGEFEKYRKKISFLNSVPGTKDNPRLFLLMMPGAIESFRFDDFDLVLSDSSSFAHGAITKGKLHICYCHTPTRFLWTEPKYLDQQRYPEFFKWFGRLMLPRMREWDFKAASRPHFLIANSVNVQNRIKKIYERDSVVIPPPVETDFYKPQGPKQDYFLTVMRLEPYKKVDVIIEAFNELGWPLKIVGTGTVKDILQKIAKPNIEFLGRISDEELKKRYAEAKGFVYAAEEDAGIVLIEAQASGTPVVAYGKGGALESVIEGVTGEFFYEQTRESLIQKLKAFDPAKYKLEDMRKNAENFSKKIFQERIKKFVEEKYNEFKSTTQKDEAKK